MNVACIRITRGTTEAQTNVEAEDRAQVVENLPSVHKPHMVAPTCSPSTREVGLGSDSANVFVNTHVIGTHRQGPEPKQSESQMLTFSVFPPLPFASVTKDLDSCLTPCGPDPLEHSFFCDNSSVTTNGHVLLGY